MSIIQGHAKSSGVTAFYPATIDQSLRFEDGDSAYLTWTPASAGNRKTWTWSGWVKRGNLAGQAGEQALFVCRSGSESTYTRIIFRTDDELWVHSNTGLSLNTSAVYRDPSAWYHIVVALDTTQATAANRCKIYVNGEQVTAFATETYPTQNTDLAINRNVIHTLGVETANSTYWDGYLAEVHFTDGTAYTADAFGELKSGIWVPKEVSVTYGTNGFYLPFNEDVTVEGFNTVTYRGNGGTKTVTGVGFQPDLVWTKGRNNTYHHLLYDSVRGATKYLQSSSTGAEVTGATTLISFDSDGYTLGAGDNSNATGSTNGVGWCWDAGDGDPVSNTNGSITSTVKANTAYGFSMFSIAGNATSGATVGHGLNQAPDVIIIKNRDTVKNWPVYHSGMGAGTPEDYYTFLNSTYAQLNASTAWNDTAPTSSVFTIGTLSDLNLSGDDHIAYCWHSVSGYSDFGSYTGDGTTSNKITTGFKPSLVIIKVTSASGYGWVMHDSTRDPRPTLSKYLLANTTAAEGDLVTQDLIEFNADGFTHKSANYHNINGVEYIYMAFADTRDAAFWLDQSGNDNDWTPNSLEHSDVVPDSPTNNFATLNPLTLTVGASSNGTLSEGNLQWIGTSSNDNLFGTMAVSSGQWYYELEIVANASTLVAGWSTTDETVNSTETALVYYNSAGIRNGTKTVVWDSDVTTGLTFAVDDIIGFALDIDSGDLKVYQNNSLVSTITLPTDKGDEWIPAFGDSSSTDASFRANFGQDSTFAGNVTAGGNTDDNGIGDFKYAPPSGFLALCTSNLPDPVIDPAQDATPEDYFNTVLYTGDGTSSQAITGVGFQPDFLWIKSRSGTGHNGVWDVTRGVTHPLLTNSTNAEATSPAGNDLLSFDADGFTVGTSNILSININAVTYVGWNWKAGGTGVANTDGSITSTVSANTDAGFSIVGYTGTGAALTAGHGLTQAPEMIIVKDRDGNFAWPVYHIGTASDAETDYLALNSTIATQDESIIWNDTAPTSSVFTVGTYNSISAHDYIAYCFHSVDGFSKVGSYIGNGSADGTFVYTGFRPAFVMVKSTSTQNWYMMDTARNPYNEQYIASYADLSNAENTTTTNHEQDYLSNGFKIRNTEAGFNTSSQTYIYIAFAEQPFKYSNAR